MSKAVIPFVLALTLFFLAGKAYGRSSYASWFGPGLYGNRMACGGVLSPGTWGVANKSLPCGTRIMVCLKRCATATVVDRGPFVAGREFDLTSALAHYIGLVGIQLIEWKIK